MTSSSLKRGSRTARLMSKRVCWLVYGRGQASTWSDSISCSTVGLATILLSDTVDQSGGNSYSVAERF